MDATKQQLTTVIAGADRDPFHILYMGLMRPSDEVLISKGGTIHGLKIYDEIERDCHAYSVIQKRKFAVISFPWEMEPASSSYRDRKAAEGIGAILKAMDFDGLCVGLMDALLKGYAVGEVLWNPATWTPDKVVMRDQRRFVFDAESRPRLITLQNMLPGEELPDRKFIVHRFGAKDGNPYGLGLGSKLFWPTFFKRQGISFWLVFAEKFGSPTAIGKYPEGMPVDKQNALLQTLGDLAQETAIIAPLETQIELLEAARSGSIDTYERLVRYMDEEISKAVLGETLTTTLGNAGSYAASKTHNEVRLELVRSDSDLLSASLHDSLLTWLTELHFPGAGVPRVWRKVQEAVDLKAEAEKDEIVFGMGFEPEEAWIQEKYGQGWKKKATPKPPLQAPFPQATPNQAPSQAFAEGADQDSASKLSQTALARSGKAMETLLKPIRQAVDESGDLHELREKLDQMYPELDATAFSELLEQAFLVAALAGRFDVLAGK
jgi:phage gp29-like protein